MQTKGPSEKQEEGRDIELENTVGNLMVAEYHVEIQSISVMGILMATVTK